MRALQIAPGIAVLAFCAIALTTHAASTIPSIEITAINSGAANACSGSGLDVQVILNNAGVEYDNYEIYDGSTLLYRWVGENYAGVGPNSYGISGSFATVPDNTILTGVIYTFPSSSLPPTPYTPDKYSYRSQIRWNCTTGALVDISNSVGGLAPAVATAVPAAGPFSLSALFASLLALGVWSLRQRVSRPRR